MGMTQHQALVAILCAQLLFMVVNGLLMPHVCITLIVVIDILIFVAMNMCITWFVKRRGRGAQLSA